MSKFIDSYLAGISDSKAVAIFMQVITKNNIEKIGRWSEISLMIKTLFEDTVVLFVKMLSISVVECAVILVGFVIIGRKPKAKSNSMNWAVTESDGIHASVDPN